MQSICNIDLFKGIKIEQKAKTKAKMMMEKKKKMKKIVVSEGSLKRIFQIQKGICVHSKREYIQAIILEEQQQKKKKSSIFNPMIDNTSKITIHSTTEQVVPWKFIQTRYEILIRCLIGLNGFDSPKKKKQNKPLAAY